LREGCAPFAGILPADTDTSVIAFFPPLPCESVPTDSIPALHTGIGVIRVVITLLSILHHKIPTDGSHTTRAVTSIIVVSTTDPRLDAIRSLSAFEFGVSLTPENVVRGREQTAWTEVAGASCIVEARQAGIQTDLAVIALLIVTQVRKPFVFFVDLEVIIVIRAGHPRAVVPAERIEETVAAELPAAGLTAIAAGASRASVATDAAANAATVDAELHLVLCPAGETVPVPSHTEAAVVTLLAGIPDEVAADVLAQTCCVASIAFPRLTESSQRRTAFRILHTLAGGTCQGGD